MGSVSWTLMCVLWDVCGMCTNGRVDNTNMINTTAPVKRGDKKTRKKYMKVVHKSCINHIYIIIIIHKSHIVPFWISATTEPTKEFITVEPFIKMNKFNYVVSLFHFIYFIFICIYILTELGNRSRFFCRQRLFISHLHGYLWPSRPPVSVIISFSRLFIISFSFILMEIGFGEVAKISERKVNESWWWEM